MDILAVTPIDQITENRYRRLAGELPAAHLVRHAVDAESLERGTVGVWVLNCPHAHPHWSRYYVFLVHLRGEVDGKPAYLAAPTATHEFHVCAVNPDEDRDLFAELTLPLLHPPVRLLRPTDQAMQFVAEGDADAAQRLERVLLECVAGKVSPDQDFRRLWLGLFPGSVSLFGTIVPDGPRAAS